MHLSLHRRTRDAGASQPRPAAVQGEVVGSGGSAEGSTPAAAPPGGESAGRLVPALHARRPTVDEFSAYTPEKLELIDGHLPGEEDLLLLLLTSIGLRRAAEVVVPGLLAQRCCSREVGRGSGEGGGQVEDEGRDRTRGTERFWSLVALLAELAPPGLPLDPWFLEIVRAGTGREFASEDNARWAEATRPIVEAFLHARFFVEMAVRYGRLEEPASLLPSGYAALLCLYGLR